MDTEAVLTLLQETAAQVINPRFQALVEGEVSEKKPGDYVTVADREAEEMITDRIRDALPDVLVVGEEATAARPELLVDLGLADHAFILDPIDGTRNFVNGSRDHAVMLAEVRSGETVRAWIWQPQWERSWVAEKGGGVMLDGKPLTAADPVAPWHGRTSAKELMHTETAEVRRIPWSTSCCGVDYPMVAAGEEDFLAYRTRLMPWDHLPGVLMVREMGGIARTVSGLEYEVGILDTSLVVARNEDIWHAVAKLGRVAGLDNRR
ncbi:inositol monophosphatase family protein [Parenemella sanctibonifatiensis]|uniref:Inositol monophosphatase n=1 Tax=Parenemella sanctibonifatiensis TaxID=2016505 RepID=A0A255EKB6_9ACTN|nr:inositol monophosphatase [Parenemella sanctibonifatiensis]OYN91989.1 inositol monophosphatase [Parenemella sanctibonifatiensis]